MFEREIFARNCNGKNNGSETAEGNYKGGIKEGEWYDYIYSHGYGSGYYKDGKQVGIWRTFNDDGSLKEEIDCDKGECDPKW